MGGEVRLRLYGEKLGEVGGLQVPWGFYRHAGNMSEDRTQALGG